MSLYPDPFSVLPSTHSFGNLFLEIQIDHNTKTANWVFPAVDRIGHIIKDTDDVSAWFGNHHGVNWRSGISTTDEQWNPDTVFNNDLSYDAYCQAYAVLRSDTSRTNLLTTEYNSRPVGITFDYSDRRGLIIGDAAATGFGYYDEMNIADATYRYYSNRYTVDLIVDGNYQYPDTDEEDEPPPPGTYQLYLMKTDDNGLSMNEYGTSTYGMQSGWGFENDKFYLIY